MSEDQFTKLFINLEQMFDEIDKRFDEMASKLSIDDISRRLEEIAKQTGVKLPV